MWVHGKKKKHKIYWCAFYSNFSVLCHDQTFFIRKKCSIFSVPKIYIFLFQRKLVRMHLNIMHHTPNVECRKSMVLDKLETVLTILIVVFVSIVVGQIFLCFYTFYCMKASNQAPMTDKSEKLSKDTKLLLQQPLVPRNV